MEFAKEEKVPDELKEKLKEMFPGMTIKFAGDDSGVVPPSVIAKSDQLSARWRDSIEKGTCSECGKKMPVENWTPDQEPTEGWVVWEDIGTNEAACLVCPGCEERTSAEPDELPLEGENGSAG